MPDRQKIMVKGGLLKDDTEWAKAGIKNGQRLMMMGTADTVPVAPEKTQVRVIMCYNILVLCRELIITS